MTTSRTIAEILNCSLNFFLIFQNIWHAGGEVQEKPEVIVEKIVRNKRKCVTIIKGLDMFGKYIWIYKLGWL